MTAYEMRISDWSSIVCSSDLIKITATGGVLSQQARGLEGHFTSAELQSIADTAHSLGLKVMAHAHGAGGITASAAAGIDSIEHGTFADDATLKVMKAKDRKSTRLKSSH